MYERKRIWIDQKPLPNISFSIETAYNDETYRIVRRTRKINNLKKTASAAAVFLVEVFETARFAFNGDGGYIVECSSSYYYKIYIYTILNIHV